MDENVAFGILPLNSPSAVTDAVLVRRFEINRDVLVIARGSLLEFAYQEAAGFKVRTEFNLFGTVAKVVPIRHPLDQQSNILIVLEDRRYAVLRFVAGQISTVQFGSLCSSFGVPIDGPFRVRQAPNGILVQFFHQVIEFFRVTPNSQLSLPLNFPVPVKSVIDFDFLGNCDGIVRVAVLIEDFKQKTRVQVYESDERLQFFVMKPGATTVVKNDSYKLQPITDNSVVVFTTSAAFRIVFHASSPPNVQSSSIFTSSRLSLFLRMSPGLFLVADQDANLMCMFMADGGRLRVNRIGAIRAPVALVGVSGESALAIARNGTASSVLLHGKDNSLRAEIRDMDIVSGTIEKVIEVNNNEFVGLCRNNRAQLIRETLKLRKHFTISMPHATGVWFCGPNKLILSFESTSRMAILDSARGLEPISDPRFVSDEPTLAAGIVADGCYAQVTKRTVNITNCSPVSFHHIICGHVMRDFVSIVHENSGVHVVSVINASGNMVYSIELPVMADAISCNGTLCVVASWADHSVFAFNLAKGELVRTISDVTGIDMAFIEGYLVVADAMNKVHLYSLSDERQVHSLYCDGLHYSIMRIDNTRVVVTGEKPVLIEGPIVKGFEFHSLTKGSVCENNVALLSEDKLYLCTSLGYGMMVREERLETDILDIEPMPDSTKFAIAVECDRSISVGIAEHPMGATLNPVVPIGDSYGDYIGIASSPGDGNALIAVLFSQMLLLYEFDGHFLQKRSELPLANRPFCILSFRQGFIVGFRQSFHLYEPDVVSRSDIRLRKTTEMMTQGSSSYIDCDESIVAVADQLQSLVLYDYDEETSKFAEVARHCSTLGLSCCKMRGDDYFCADNNGNFYRLVIGDTQNLDSSDLVIVSCCNLGQKVLSIGIFSSKEPRLLIGTQLGQYMEMVSFAPSKDLDILYKQLSLQVQSLGKFNLTSYRTVVIGHVIPRARVLYDLGMLGVFLRLDPRLQNAICSKIGINLQTAREICLNMLARA